MTARVGMHHPVWGSSNRGLHLAASVEPVLRGPVGLVTSLLCLCDVLVCSRLCCRVALEWVSVVCERNFGFILAETSRGVAWATA